MKKYFISPFSITHELENNSTLTALWLSVSFFRGDGVYVNEYLSYPTYYIDDEYEDCDLYIIEFLNEYDELELLLRNKIIPMIDNECIIPRDAVNRL